MTRDECLLNYYFGLINALDQQFKTLKFHRNDDSNFYKVEYEHLVTVIPPGDQAS